jgi:carnitine O-acetyltransferase
MNRWCDKPVQLIVFDNARAGLMGEHSLMDGTPTCRMCDDVLTMIADPAFDHGTPPPAAAAAPATPKAMDWTITPTLVHAIDAASAAAVSLIRSQTVGFHLTAYGKRAIKAFGVSPDGWAQMVIQLAYARLLATLAGKRGFTPDMRRGATYEAATTRKFYKGRTEAIRVVSVESDAWVQTMDNPQAGRGEKQKAFMRAVGRHGTDARRCGAAMAVDRHLFGTFHGFVRPR